jgi:hypothetical protein
MTQKDLKSLRRNLQQKIHDARFGDKFLDTMPKVKATKEKINWTS